MGRQIAALYGLFPKLANLAFRDHRQHTCKAKDDGSITCFDRGHVLYTETMKNKSESPAHAFYAEVLRILKDSKFTFMVAGGFAVNAYTGLRRPTKDIDIFVKAGDYRKF